MNRTILWKELNKTKASTLLHVEFRTLIIWVLNELRGTPDQLSENSHRETIKKDEAEMNTIKRRAHQIESTADYMRKKDLY